MEKSDSQLGARTSKTIVLTKFGGYDKLVIENRKYPAPQEGEVVVNIRAAGLNFAELMCLQGVYELCPKPPCVIGYEGSGDVVEVGPGVKDFKAGDRVMCVNKFGGWCEYFCTRADRIFKMPPDMSYEVAAAIPVNYVTAYHMLFNMAHLRENQNVLVHMVAGGVGFAATQLCKMVPGVQVFGTCSAPKHDAVRKNGVDYPIDYRTQDYVEEIRKISPKGVNIVLDPLNGPDAEKGYNLLKPLGTIIHFGAANIVAGEKRSIWRIFKTWWKTKSINPLFMLSHNKMRGGFHLGYLSDNEELIRGVAQELLKLYTEGKIKPMIDSVWAFEDIGKGMARMHDRKNVGKVIISPQMKPGQEDIRASTK